MKIKNINHHLIFSVMILAMFFVCQNKVSALTLSPARIEVSGDPGTTVQKEITLLNDSKTGEETYYVSYSNFEAQGETGSPLFVEPKNDLGTWMTTEQSITLKADESKKIVLNINIPKDAYSGGHFAVVFFGNNPAENGGGQVSVGAKTGTLILLTVKGDVLEAGGLASFNTETYKNKNGESVHKLFYNSLPVNLEYRWKNDGNDRVKPAGKVIIRNMFYLPVVQIDANAVSGNILPHSTRLFNIEWLKVKDDNQNIKGISYLNSFINRVSYQWKNFAIGPYFASLDLVYGQANNHSSKHTFFFVLPWQLLIVILFIATILFYVGKKMLSQYNKHIIKMARLGMKLPNDAHDA